MSRTLSDKQWDFLQDLAKLVLFAEQKGYKLTGGELYRTLEQQKSYVDRGLSKTLNSKHLSRLAVDLNLFVNGVYVGSLPQAEQVKEYLPLGMYWKSLRLGNVSGAVDWGWDANHFEAEG